MVGPVSPCSSGPLEHVLLLIALVIHYHLVYGIHLLREIKFSFILLGRHRPGLWLYLISEHALRRWILIRIFVAQALVGQ